MRRWLPVVLLAVGAALLFASGLNRYLNFELLRAHRVELLASVDANLAIYVIGFIMVYAAAIVFIPPSGTTLTVTGGFLFGVVLGTALTVVAATLGATALFLIARLTVGDALRRRAGPGRGSLAWRPGSAATP